MDLLSVKFQGKITKYFNFFTKAFFVTNDECFQSSCGHEYLDIYTEVLSSDPADLINSPFGGRYCGPIPPKPRISMYRAIALSFFTSKNSTSPDLFEGRFTFINACKLFFFWIESFSTNFFQQRNTKLVYQLLVRHVPMR